jgi:hypothetical protein
MKYPFFNVRVLCLFLFSSVVVRAQKTSGNIDSEIRKLEADQVDYLLSGRVVEMRKNWDTNYTVNNPFNVVQDAASGPIQSGVLTYSKFERVIEKVLIHDSVVIVMGNELVVPRTAPPGTSHDTNQPIRRRFTNVWQQKTGKWLMIARHASNVCGN